MVTAAEITLFDLRRVVFSSLLYRRRLTSWTRGNRTVASTTNDAPPLTASLIVRTASDAVILSGSVAAPPVAPSTGADGNLLVAIAREADAAIVTRLSFTFSSWGGHVKKGSITASAQGGDQRRVGLGWIGLAAPSDRKANGRKSLTRAI